MIGRLPESLEIQGKNYKIRTDFRVILSIFEMLQDKELKEYEKAELIIKMLFVDSESVPVVAETFEKASAFMDGKKIYIEPTEQQMNQKIMDWVQDEELYIGAINQNLKAEVRQMCGVHWWTFLDWFQGVGDSLFARVIDIRQKKLAHKMDDSDFEFYKKYTNLVDFKTKDDILQEREEMDNILKLIDGDEKNE